MAAVQMNVRIDEETKARGDEVFARWGLTPSQVVRAVWEYAEEKGEPPAFMRPARDAADDAEVQRRLALVEEGASIWRNFFIDNGLPVPAPRKITFEDLREDEYFGKLKEELDDDEVHEAYYDDLRDEMYDEMLEEMGL
ncbi:type II toxin-antitoxin system RelB/DinJ family antitoxin [Gordonibacter massiliensis (ex Traore et al. 2017)]|uniref:Type II toxin-antitoxin system RelB/DinJ family antitoxin n=1 Tax=Gordonibacter massiliensis (ex Traore et al. 2017) TaxID=1841863 RepID=A0A842JDJ8_9ACTN|nr:type II toxin-antitoxin system RelB/DinJ family antitoxin [Gordonibacter massiliensis (ex Traore et al. 2017)]MBC2889504.1 type II toxin-antitoxin system RelB/DinJ family antitoxin [Gordonibacter massiliensis (ex Traore et al. 2017)]